MVAKRIKKHRCPNCKRYTPMKITTKGRGDVPIFLCTKCAHRWKVNG